MQEIHYLVEHPTSGLDRLVQDAIEKDIPLPLRVKRIGTTIVHLSSINSKNQAESDSKTDLCPEDNPAEESIFIPEGFRMAKNKYAKSASPALNVMRVAYGVSKKAEHDQIGRRTRINIPPDENIPAHMEVFLTEAE